MERSGMGWDGSTCTARMDNWHLATHVAIFKV